MSRFMLNEYNYFRTLEGQQGISLPRTFFLAYDEFSDRSVLLMEDLKGAVIAMAARETHLHLL